MCKHLSLSIASLLCFGSAASAGTITYDVKVNTSSIAGTAGSLDFNFNPGPLITQAAPLQVLDFAGNGTLTGAPSLTGDVSGGPLPATVTFDNGSGFNDYFRGFTYGSALSFQVSLYGPALSSPNGTATSGSAFAFSMFSDPAGTAPLLTNNLTDGFALTVNVNLDGTTTLTNFSSETTAVVPKPSTVVLIGTAIALMGAVLWRKRRPRRRTCGSSEIGPLRPSRPSTMTAECPSYLNQLGFPRRLLAARSECPPA